MQQPAINEERMSESSDAASDISTLVTPDSRREQGFKAPGHESPSSSKVSVRRLRTDALEDLDVVSKKMKNDPISHIHYDLKRRVRKLKKQHELSVLNEKSYRAIKTKSN